MLAAPLQLGEIRLETGSGVVPVTLEREGARIVFGRMQQPIPELGAVRQAEELSRLLGVRSQLPVEVYDNGVRTHVFLELAQGGGRGARARLRCARRLDALGVNCFAGRGRSWKTRMFAPASGVAEDPATGSAAGPLAHPLGRHGRIEPATKIEISQGAEIGRPSTLYAAWTDRRSRSSASRSAAPRSSSRAASSGSRPGVMRTPLIATLLAALTLAAAGTAAAACDKGSLDLVDAGKLDDRHRQPGLPAVVRGRTPKGSRGRSTTPRPARASSRPSPTRSPSSSASRRATVKWKYTPFNRAFAPGPKAFDFDINQISFTPARAKVVSFSDSYYDVNQAIVVIKGTKIAGVRTSKGLKPYKLGAQLGTTSYEYIVDRSSRRRSRPCSRRTPARCRR